MKNEKSNKHKNHELINNFKAQNKNQILKTKQISLLSYSRNSPNESKTQKSTLFNDKKNKKNNSNEIDSLNSSYLQKKNICTKNLSSSMNDIKQSILNTNRRNYKKTNSINQKSKNNLNEQFELYLKNKYNKYNTLEQAYKILNEYSKMEFNDNDDFIQRMDNYSSKRRLQEEKINELLKKQKPTLPEDKLIKTFNRLIEDSNRRNESKNKQICSDDILMNEINHHLKKNKSDKTIIKRDWKVIYNERFQSKLNNYKQNLEKQREDNLKKKHFEEENEINEMKRYWRKTILSPEKLNEITNRLYYKPIWNKLMANMEMYTKKNRELENLTNSTYSSKISKNCTTKNSINKNKNKINNKSEIKKNNYYNYDKNNNFNNNNNYVPLTRVERIIDDFFTDK